MTLPHCTASVVRPATPYGKLAGRPSGVFGSSSCVCQKNIQTGICVLTGNNCFIGNPTCMPWGTGCTCSCV
jgi:hypothetical protein